MTVTLDGIYDMHVHSALDIIPRKCSDLDLAEQGVQANAAGIVLKYHQGDTTPRAYLCNEYVQKKYPNSHFKMYGSLTMNLPVGGFNIHAVDVAIQNNASVIWMPTIDAENDRKKQHKTGGLTIFDENNNLKQEVLDILKRIQEANVVLATGHLSPKEIIALVKQARDMYIKKIVITHPEFWIVGLTHAEQLQLVEDYGVILEHCFKQPLSNGCWKNNLEDLISLVKEIGSSHIMLDTDSGQPMNPSWSQAWQEILTTCLQQGISEKDLYHMTHEIPEELLRR